MFTNNEEPYKLKLSDCVQFLKSLPDESLDLIVTDPAYSGMNEMLKLGHGRIVGNYQKDRNSKWFEEFKDDPENFYFFLRECYRALKNDRHIYIMFDSYSLLTLGPVVREVFDVKNIIVWDKVNIGMGHYHRRRHELVLFASKGKRKLNARNIPDVWSVKRIHKAKYPTQKPVEVFDMMLAGSAQPGYVVCDPFVGSGSALISAIKNDCKFIGSDISERSVSLARERAEHFITHGVDPFEMTRDASRAITQVQSKAKTSTMPIWQT
jgi:site-specific DNA-methyltransferase (adenine-specific)